MPDSEGRLDRVNENPIPLDEAELVAGALGGLKPGNPVLRCALRILRGEAIESIQPLHNSLKEVSPKCWQERITAAWTLGRAPLGAEDSDAAAGTLMNLLENVYRERSRFKFVRWTFRTYLATMAIAVIASTGAYVDFIHHYSDPGWLNMVTLMTTVFGTAILPFSMIFQSVFEKGRNDRVRAAAARALGNRGHVEALGPLAGCLFDSSLVVRQACGEALHVLLPAITDADYGVLGADSVSKLGRALTDSDGTLVAKALDALEKVGTSHAIPYVERLLKDTRSTLVRDRAQRVLEVLNARKKREAAGEGLLRAITSPQEPTGLLRPAQSAAESELEQLLRPAGDSLN